MAQNRDAPAYQEYAAAMLAQLPFRSSSLAERGLLYTMRLECWVNGMLPADPKSLARVLGYPVEEVAGLLGGVMVFFHAENGFIVCPELDDYRAHLEERKRRQSEGGKTGAALTNKRRKRSGGRKDKGLEGKPSSKPTSEPQVPRRGQVESLVQSSTEQPSPEKLTGGGVISENDFPDFDAGLDGDPFSDVFDAEEAEEF